MSAERHLSCPRILLAAGILIVSDSGSLRKNHVRKRAIVRLLITICNHCFVCVTACRCRTSVVRALCGGCLCARSRRSGTLAAMNEEIPTFDDVVLPHLDAAYRLAVWLMRNEHDAEDVVQEASLRAFR